MNAISRYEYLSALGVPDFLYITAEQTPVIDKINTQCLVLENMPIDSFCQTGKIQDFLLKMLAAIDLKASDMQLINLHKDKSSILQNYNAKVVLAMGDVGNIKTDFNTHHPAKILNNNMLKRESWEVLKQVQQCLK